MGIPGVDRVIDVFMQLQTTTAVIFGMCVQFMFGEDKTLKVFTLIASSSLFLAFYIMPMFIKWLNKFPGIDIIPGDDFYNGLYALSALLSMELLALLINILPQAVSRKLKSILGVKNAQ